MKDQMIVKIDTIEEIKNITLMFEAIGWTYNKLLFNKIDNKPEYPFLVFYIDKKHISGNYEQYCRILSTIQDVIEQISKPTKKNLYRKEFIKAMKETVKEYIDGTHEFDYKKCKICQTLISVKYIKLDNWRVSKEQCDICPWVVTTGNTCHGNSNEYERAKELIDWIKHYEKMEDDI